MTSGLVCFGNVHAIVFPTGTSLPLMVMRILIMVFILVPTVLAALGDFAVAIELGLQPSKPGVCCSLNECIECF